MHSTLLRRYITFILLCSIVCMLCALYELYSYSADLDDDLDALDLTMMKRLGLVPRNNNSPNTTQNSTTGKQNNNTDTSAGHAKLPARFQAILNKLGFVVGLKAIHEPRKNVTTQMSDTRHHTAVQHLRRDDDDGVELSNDVRSAVVHDDNDDTHPRDWPRHLPRSNDDVTEPIKKAGSDVIRKRRSADEVKPSDDSVLDYTNSNSNVSGAHSRNKRKVMNPWVYFLDWAFQQDSSKPINYSRLFLVDRRYTTIAVYALINLCIWCFCFWCFVLTTFYCASVLHMYYRVYDWIRCVDPEYGPVYRMMTRLGVVPPTYDQFIEMRSLYADMFMFDLHMHDKKSSRYRRGAMG